MIVQNDAAHPIIEALGKMGICEFRDLNRGQSLHMRSFVEEVRKCEELARILRIMQEEIQAHSIAMGVLDDASLPPLATLEPLILQKADEIKGLKDSHDLLLKNHNSLQEQKIVLDLGSQLYQKAGYAEVLGVDDMAASSSDKQSIELMSLSEFGSATSSMLGQVAGVINRESLAALERVIFRATRGNAVFKSAAPPPPSPPAGGGGAAPGTHPGCPASWSPLHTHTHPLPPPQVAPHRGAAAGHRGQGRPRARRQGFFHDLLRRRCAS